MGSTVQCQICGRKLGLLRDGTVRHHHHGGPACPGARRRPYLDACDALDERLAALAAADERWQAWYRRYRQGNRPPAEAEFAAMRAVDRELGRLRRRRQRWDRRHWVAVYNPATGGFTRRPPESGEVGYAGDAAGRETGGLRCE